MRHETNRERVERLMAGLGRAAREPGRIYFTGGVSAVLLGWREMTADVDLNVVGTSSGRFVEIQGTAEREPFDEAQLGRLLAASRKGLAALFLAQRAALTGRIPDEWLETLKLGAPAQAAAKKSRSARARREGSSRRA